MLENKMNEIEQVLTLISNARIYSQRVLSREEKVNFAYKYWNLTTDDITELYEFLAYLHKSIKSDRVDKDIKSLGYGINNLKLANLGYFTHDFCERNMDSITRVTTKIRDNGNWLSKFNLELEFSGKDMIRPVIYSYQTPKNLVTIDREKASEIVGMLTDKSIPLASCIVKSAYPHFAHDTMTEYIEQLHKNDKDLEKIKQAVKKPQ